MSSWDDDDAEELRPLKPFRPALPRDARGGDRPRPRPAGGVPDPDGPRGPGRSPGGADRSGGPPRPATERPTGWTPSRRILLGAVGAVVLVLLVVLVSSRRSESAARDAEEAVVERFVEAYAERSYATMYEQIDADARRAYPVKRFAGLNRDAFRVATGRTIVAGPVRRSGDVFVAPITLRTERFGTIDADMRIRLAGSGKGSRVAWSRTMVFPGLRTGERLTRVAQVPARGTILFADGVTPLAKGAARSSTAPAEITSEIRGELGPIPADEREKYRDLGIPSTTKVGKNGLERLLNDRLIGRPGLKLKAGSRVVGRQKVKRAKAVVSSISLPVMQAAVQAQSSAPDGGGLIAVDTRTGEVLAFAGDAWTGPRAPGSTMKIVTAAAALQERTATTGSEYPEETSALGIQNADGESCGGTLVEAFAESCNSVFAPLAVEVGSTPFVTMAEAFGFNRAPSVAGATRSTVPDDLSDGDLALSGIGQAKVQATPLQVAMMSAIVARGGLRPTLTFLRTDDPAPTRRVVEAAVAADLRTMMGAVVTDGTGTAAALPGVDVAGKTGTAEVRTTQGAACQDGSGSGDDDPSAAADEATDDDPSSADDDATTLCDPSDSTDTDAWMSAFAPASGSDRAPIAVGVLRRGDGQGGATAAPVARAVLEAALQP